MIIEIHKFDIGFILTESRQNCQCSSWHNDSTQTDHWRYGSFPLYWKFEWLSFAKLDSVWCSCCLRGWWSSCGMLMCCCLSVARFNSTLLDMKNVMYSRYRLKAMAKNVSQSYTDYTQSLFMFLIFQWKIAIGCVASCVT